MCLRNFRFSNAIVQNVKCSTKRPARFVSIDFLSQLKRGFEKKKRKRINKSSGKKYYTSMIITCSLVLRSNPKPWCNRAEMYVISKHANAWSGFGTAQTNKIFGFHQYQINIQSKSKLRLPSWAVLKSCLIVTTPPSFGSELYQEWVIW